MHKRNENEKQEGFIFVKQKIIFQKKIFRDTYELMYGETSDRLIKSKLFFKTLGIFESLKKEFH